MSQRFKGKKPHSQPRHIGGGFRNMAFRYGLENQAAFEYWEVDGGKFYCDEKIAEQVYHGEEN